MFDLAIKGIRMRDKLANWRRDFPLYLRRIRLNPEFGRYDSAPAQEVEHPYREGTAFVFRVAGSFGLTLGIMNNHADSTDREVNRRLMKALKGADGGKAYVMKVRDIHPDIDWLEQHGISPESLISLDDTVEPEA